MAMLKEMTNMKIYAWNTKLYKVIWHIWERNEIPKWKNARTKKYSDQWLYLAADLTHQKKNLVNWKQFRTSRISFSRTLGQIFSLAFNCIVTLYVNFTLSCSFIEYVDNYYFCFFTEAVILEILMWWLVAAISLVSSSECHNSFAY